MSHLTHQPELCGYKFLNGEPGAPAFCYVNTRHLYKVDPKDDITRGAEILEEIMTERLCDTPEFHKRSKVT